MISDSASEEEINGVEAHDMASTATMTVLQIFLFTLVEGIQIS
jgi:hypothetical protein